MLRRASRGVIYLTKSRIKNLCENILSEERFLALYPPPADRIKQQAEVRAEFQSALKSLAASAKNNQKSTSNELSDITSWTLQDIQSGNLNTNQLMNLAKLRFNGNTGPSVSDQDSVSSSTQEARDPALAVAAWVQASKQGNTDASYSVAFCLLNGIGIERDEQEAFALMYPLANSYDNPYAHYALGNMYLKGLGAAVDEQLAFSHYKAAAREGIPPAIFNLGNMFAAGVGVAQSDESALACYEGAASYGDVQAKYLLGSWLCEGRGAERNFQRGVALLVEAATAGNARASYSLGVLYLEGGQDVDRDLASAAVWFQKASGLGMCEASFNLGMLYMQGDGVPRDLQRARECFVLGTTQNEKNDACFIVLKEVDELIALEKQDQGKGQGQEGDHN